MKSMVSAKDDLPQYLLLVFFKHALLADFPLIVTTLPATLAEP